MTPMRLVIFVEYVTLGHWRKDAWSPLLARGLAARGHDVLVACDSAHDVSAFEPARVVVRHPLRTRHEAQPFRFARWARMIRAAEVHDVSLSMTPLAAADVMLSISEPAMRRLASTLRRSNLVSAGMDLVHEPMLPITALAEARASRSVLIQRRLTIAASEPGTIVRGCESIGLASALDPPSDESRAKLRARVRAMFDLHDDATVLLTSAMHPYRAGGAAMLEALAHVRMGEDGHVPRVLIAGRYNVRLHEAAVRAGCADRIIFLGGTARMDAALCAADVAVAPGPMKSLPGTGRFIADSIRLGVPVITAAGVPGAGLVRGDGGTVRPGIVLDGNQPNHWREAIEAMLDPSTRREAAAAAASRSPMLEFSTMVSRIEAILVECASQRRRTGV